MFSCWTPCAVAARFVVLCALCTVLAGVHPAGADVVRLTPQQAVSRAVEYNLALAVERSAPELSLEPQRAADSKFDPTLSISSSYLRSPGTFSVGIPQVSNNSGNNSLSVFKKFSTGTNVEANFQTNGLWIEDQDGGYETVLQLRLTQSLLRGISRTANELPIISAQLTRKMSEKSFEFTTQGIIVETLKVYWTLYASLAQVKVQDLALKSTETTFNETKALIDAGKLPKSEAASAQYAVEIQKRAKLETIQNVANARERLARIVGLMDPHSLLTPEIETQATPATELPAVSPETLHAEALENRGDYRALLEEMKLRQMEYDVAGHNRLPLLDIIGGIGGKGYSGSSDVLEGGSYLDSYSFDGLAWGGGLEFSYPFGNNQGQANHEIAAIKLRRAQLAADLAVQEISQQLNIAWRAVQIAYEQLRLTQAAAQLAEIKFHNERERYFSGKITAHILSTVQDEVNKERLAQEEAIANFNKSLVDLFAVTGRLNTYVEKS